MFQNVVLDNLKYVFQINHQVYISLYLIEVIALHVYRQLASLSSVSFLSLMASQIKIDFISFIRLEIH